MVVQPICNDREQMAHPQAEGVRDLVSSATSARSYIRNEALTFFFLMNNTSSAARGGAAGGGGGRPGGGAGRGRPFGAFVPLGIGRLGADVGRGLGGAFPFRCGFLPSGLGAEEEISDDRFEGVTFGGRARSFCASEEGA